MDIVPRHVICVLGTWNSFEEVEAVVAACGDDFILDREYSQLSHDERMTGAFEASADRVRPSITETEWTNIGSHTAVAYILSPPIRPQAAESISARSLVLTATILSRLGGIAAKSESAGLAHGRDQWIDLGHRYMTALKHGDTHSARTTLFWAWVRRIIHDEMGMFHSCGMHLLGQPDAEIEDSIDEESALEWIDLLGLYLVADKPDRPLKDGEGFRLRDEGPRRVIRRVPCQRYDDDEFFFNPYGYIRLVAE